MLTFRTIKSLTQCLRSYRKDRYDLERSRIHQPTRRSTQPELIR